MVPVEAVHKPDTLGEATRVLSVEQGIAQPHINSAALKRYTLKCDLIIIPMVSFSYLLEYALPPQKVNSPNRPIALLTGPIWETQKQRGYRRILAFMETNTTSA